TLGEDVTIWRIDLSAGAQRSLDSLAQILDDLEMSRWRRLRRADAAARFAASHVALRVILGRVLGQAPHEIRFAQEENGKPTLADRELQFNLAHSGDVALVAVGGRRALGVDVEEIRRVPNLASMIRFACTPVEKQEIEDAPDEAARTKLFLEHWVRKEAAAKAVGQGLRIPLKRIEFVSNVWRAPACPPAAASVVHVQEAQCPGALAALASLDQPCRFQMHCFCWRSTEAVGI
ncbi:MAG: 4'-phosphopantetheinyl transferase superfamily protein, partial [Pseudomonadota bacterium]